jgi:predicted transcriptional regulator
MCTGVCGAGKGTCAPTCVDKSVSQLDMQAKAVRAKWGAPSDSPRYCANTALAVARSVKACEGWAGLGRAGPGPACYL